MTGTKHRYREIALYPFDAVDEQVLSMLEAQLPEKTGRRVVRAAVIPIPSSAYDKIKIKYFGDMLLAILRDAVQGREAYALGIIDRDCYAEGLNFIFGEAALKGQEAFVALVRLRETFYGRPANDRLFKERILKEAVHEIGHLFGLTHCPDSTCVMSFSNTIQDTDRKNTEYCSRCRKLFD